MGGLSLPKPDGSASYELETDSTATAALLKQLISINQKVLEKCNKTFDSVYWLPVYRFH
jgi:hypothetical protein